MKTINKIHNYLENKTLNLYWVIILALGVVCETTLLQYYMPSKNEFWIGILFGVWALNFYILRKVFIMKIKRSNE